MAGLLLFPALLLSSTGQKAKLPEYIPGEVIVTYKDNLVKPQSGKEFMVSKVYSHLSRLEEKSVAFIRSKTLSTEALIVQLKKDPNVARVEPNYVHRVMDRNLPDDSRFSEEWGMDNNGSSGGTADADTDAPEAWSTTTGSKDYVVAVFDTGVDYLHEDLKDNMWTNPGETDGNHIDDDGNGFTDDYYGYDFAADNDGNDDSDPAPDTPYGESAHYHGTHVAGIIGATGNNAKGVAGVNWTTSIMAIKIFRPNGGAVNSDILDAIDYVIDMKENHSTNIVAVNASYGPSSGSGGSAGDTMNDAIDALGDAGILFVAAAGNAGNNNDSSVKYPASYTSENIIAVAATDSNDALASFSNYGHYSVDLAAPGVDILSTYVTDSHDQYALLSGTSMATPYVTGTVAMVWSAFGDKLDMAGVKRHILNNVDKLGTLDGMVLSGGRLNLAEAVVNHLKAQDDAVETKHGRSVTIDVLANDEEQDGDPLSFELLTKPDASEGNVSIEENKVVYTPPDDDFRGTVTFQVRVTDSIDENDSNVTVTVTDNHPPVAANDTASVAKGHSVSVAVMRNDHDADHDALHLVAVTSAPSHGSASVHGDRIVYVPQSDYVGKDYFSYRVADDEDANDTAQVSVNVYKPAPPPPAPEEGDSDDDTGGGNEGTEGSDGGSSGGGGDSASVLSLLLAAAGLLLIGLREISPRREGE